MLNFFFTDLQTDEMRTILSRYDLTLVSMRSIRTTV